MTLVMLRQAKRGCSLTIKQPRFVQKNLIVHVVKLNMMEEISPQLRSRGIRHVNH